MARELPHKIKQQLAPYLPGSEASSHSEHIRPVGPHVGFSSFSFRVTFGLGLASGTEGL